MMGTDAYGGLVLGALVGWAWSTFRRDLIGIAIAWAGASRSSSVTRWGSFLVRGGLHNTWLRLGAHLFDQWESFFTRPVGWKWESTTTTL